MSAVPGSSTFAATVPEQAPPARALWRNPEVQLAAHYLRDGYDRKALKVRLGIDGDRLKAAVTLASYWDAQEATA